jgi:hypothetical protein
MLGYLTYSFLFLPLVQSLTFACAVQPSCVPASLFWAPTQNCIHVRCGRRWMPAKASVPQ